MSKNAGIDGLQATPDRKRIPPTTVQAPCLLLSKNTLTWGCGGVTLNHRANTETGQAMASGSRDKVMPLAVTLVVLIQKPRAMF